MVNKIESENRWPKTAAQNADRQSTTLPRTQWVHTDGRGLCTTLAGGSASSLERTKTKDAWKVLTRRTPTRSTERETETHQTPRRRQKKSDESRHNEDSDQGTNGTEKKQTQVSENHMAGTQATKGRHKTMRNTSGNGERCRILLRNDTSVRKHWEELVITEEADIYILKERKLRKPTQMAMQSDC